MIDRNHPIGSNRRQSYLCRSHRLGPSDSAATDAGGDHVRRCITLAAVETHPADELAQAPSSGLAAVGAEGLQRRQFMQSATWCGPHAA